MRISDWSSDVCSSDLPCIDRHQGVVDDGRSVAFDLKDYAHVDHGYAATIHKSQGVTVDRAHVLATPGMDRHSASVALSRHRDGEIGRASCRERVCQYVENSGVGVSVKKQKYNT